MIIVTSFVHLETFLEGFDLVLITISICTVTSWKQGKSCFVKIQNSGLTDEELEERIVRRVTRPKES